MLDRIMCAVAFVAFLATLMSTLESPLRAELEDSRAENALLQDEIDFLRGRDVAPEPMPAISEFRRAAYEVPLSPQPCLTGA